MSNRILLHRWDDVPLDKVTEMVARKSISGTRATMTQAYFKKGARVPRHTREGETFIYVLQGVVRLMTGADDVTVREGEMLVVPPDIAYQGEVLDDAFVLTVTAAANP